MLEAKGLKKFLIVCLGITALWWATSGVGWGAHAGPSEWSLRGLASWAQILTASGTAAPATSTGYTVGDLYIQYEAGNASWALWRIASGGTWGVIAGGGGGGVATHSSLTNLQYSSSGHTGFAPATTTTDLTNHIASATNPHGSDVTFGGSRITGSGVAILLTNRHATQASAGAILQASGSSGFELAVTSSTYAVGVLVATTSAATDGWVLTSGLALAFLEDGKTATGGDALMVSDTQAGTVEPTTYQPASGSDEVARVVGYAVSNSAGGRVLMALRFQGSSSVTNYDFTDASGTMTISTFTAAYIPTQEVTFSTNSMAAFTATATAHNSTPLANRIWVNVANIGTVTAWVSTDASAASATVEGCIPVYSQTCESFRVPSTKTLSIIASTPTALIIFQEAP